MAFIPGGLRSGGAGFAEHRLLHALRLLTASLVSPPPPFQLYVFSTVSRMGMEATVGE